jgi:flagellar hook-length control protein FliK
MAAELMARMQAQSQGESASGAFNAWMERHAMTADKLQATPEANKTAATPAQTAATPTRDSQSTASRLLEQALARSRQQAQAATARQLEQTAAQAAAASRQASQPKARTEGPNKEEPADKQARADEPTEAKSPAKATSEEANAIVEELTPPPEVKTDDAQAMMAWLASLTHGDVVHPHKALPKASASADSSASSNASTGGQALAEQTGRLDAAQASTAATGANAATDQPLWQAMQPTTAALQAEGARSFKDELSAQGGSRQVDGLAGGLGLRAAPEFKGADVARTETATLQAPVGSDTFAQALSDQVTMWVQKMPDDGAMSAELHLNPAELGPIHVKISLEGKDAQVNFAAAAVETRQAIEASMNALSTAFSDVGLNLTGGDVSAQTSQQGFQQAFGQSGDGNPAGTDGGRPQGRGEVADGVPVGRPVAAPRPGRAGGLDLYA